MVFDSLWHILHKIRLEHPMFTGIIESLGKVESLQSVAVMCVYVFKLIWICLMYI